MKKVILLAATATTVVSAQTPPAPGEPTIVRRTATVSPGAEPPPAAGEPQRTFRRFAPPPPARTGDTAALPVEFIGGMPTVAATINGKGPFRLGIETGFPGNLRLTPEAVARAGAPQVGEALSGDPSGKNPQRIAVHRVDTLSVGGVAWQAIDTGTTTIRSDRLKGLDGLLGSNLFGGLVMTVDYGGAKFALAPGALPPGPDVLPIERDRGLLVIPITIGDRTWKVHLDTGNTRHPLFMAENLIAQLPTTGDAYPIGKARTVSQELTLSAKKLAAPVRVGGTLLKIDEVGYPAVADVGNLGSLGLVGQAVTLDLANNRVRIVPSK